MKKITVIMMFCIAGLPAWGNVYFDNGITEDVDYLIDDTVYVDSQSSPMPGTTINVLTGGEITGEYTRLYNNSVLNIDGGEIMGVWAYNDSIVNIYDGDISWNITMWGVNAELNIYGGTIKQDIFTSWKLAEIWGGTFLGSIFPDDGPVKLYGNFDQGYGTYTGVGKVTGTLSNGDIINLEYSTIDSGSIILAPIPEPFSVILFSVAGLFVAKSKK